MLRFSSTLRFGRPTSALVTAFLLVLGLAACGPTPLPPTATPSGEATAAVAAATPTGSGGIVQPTSESASDDPEALATGLFDAWRRGDRASANAIAEAAAVDLLFGRTWRQTDGWIYDGCEGAAGSTFCTWHTTAGRLIIRVRNPGAGPPMRAIEVRFEVNTPAPTGQP